MTLAAEKLVDWATAFSVGRQVAGGGVSLSALDRARLAEDFADVVPRAEGAVTRFTGLSAAGYGSRPWVMTRAQWLQANLRGFERALEPFARKILGERPEGPLASVRRQVLGAQVGGLLGYLGHRVLGQYAIYFVGANVAGVERKYGFAPREFRLWISLHEVTHRLQFGGVPWLRPYVTGLMDSYLSTMDLDPAWLVESLRRALEEVRTGRSEHRGFGWVFLLMTPDQRDMVRRMQAVMSLLEGHGNFVMNAVARGEVPNAERFSKTLHERRRRRGVERLFQKAIGFDVKVSQYEHGERFVGRVIDLVGQGGFNRVWEGAANLPSTEEIGHPERWVARVAA